MNYKKCEHCGEEIHIRSKKCPFCNQTVAEVIPEEIDEEVIEEVNVTENIGEGNIEEVSKENSNNNQLNNDEAVNYEKDNMAVPPQINFAVGANGEPKDYVYKAEVRHSLEYTNQLSNMAKVFISALCTIPIIGQLIGVFMGVFFSTYEDTDRRSFGRALIFLSIFMFVMYLAYVRYAMNLLGTLDLDALYNSLGK